MGLETQDSALSFLSLKELYYETCSFILQERILDLLFPAEACKHDFLKCWDS